MTCAAEAARLSVLIETGAATSRQDVAASNDPAAIMERTLSTLMFPPECFAAFPDSNLSWRRPPHAAARRGRSFHSARIGPYARVETALNNRFTRPALFDRPKRNTASVSRGCVSPSPPHRPPSTCPAALPITPEIPTTCRARTPGAPIGASSRETTQAALISKTRRRPAVPAPTTPAAPPGGPARPLPVQESDPLRLLRAVRARVHHRRPDPARAGELPLRRAVRSAPGGLVPRCSDRHVEPVRGPAVRGEQAVRPVRRRRRGVPAAQRTLLRADDHRHALRSAARARARGVWLLARCSVTPPALARAVRRALPANARSREAGVAHHRRLGRGLRLLGRLSTGRLGRLAQQPRRPAARARPARPGPDHRPRGVAPGAARAGGDDGRRRRRALHRGHRHAPVVRQLLPPGARRQ